MTALTSPPLAVPTDDSGAQQRAHEPSRADTGSLGNETPSVHNASQPARPTPDSLTIGQAAALTGLHKNTIRAYIKQGRVAAGVVRGKYGQEYRLSRAEVVALATEIVSPVDLETSGVADAPAQFEGRGAPGASQGSTGDSGTEDSLGLTDTADPSIPYQTSPANSHNLSLEPLVGLLRQVQEENRNLAGQLGFVQAQLQQAKETIRLLQAPPETVEGSEDVVIEASGDRIAAAEEVGRLKAELDQAQRRVAEFEVVTDDLEREQAAAAAEAARRPWWRFW